MISVDPNPNGDDNAVATSTTSGTADKDSISSVTTPTTPFLSPASVDSLESLDVLIEAFQKEAIACHFREYARKVSQLESDIEALKHKNNVLLNGLTAIGGWWCEIADELMVLVSRFGLPVDLHEILHKHDCSRPVFFSALLNLENESLLESQLNCIYDEAHRIISCFIQHLSMLSPNDNSNAVRYEESLESRYASVRNQLFQVEKQNLSAVKELEFAQKYLSDRSERIKQLERMVDYLQCRTWTSIFLRPPPVSTPGLTSTSISSNINGSRPSAYLKSPLAEANTSPLQEFKATCESSNVNTPLIAPTKSEFMFPAPNLEAIDSKRLEEIQGLMSNITELRNELDSLKIQTQVLPESVLSCHPFVNVLRSQINTLSAEVQLWRQKYDENTRIISDIRQDQVSWFQKHKETMANRESIFISEQKKLHEEIVRLRKQRDEFATAREGLASERNAKLKHTETLNSHIKVKDARISMLETKLERLQSKDQENSTQAPVNDSQQMVELLTAEVNAVAEGYAKLDQGLTKATDVIKEKEDYIIKLIGDKTKLDSKVLFLRKQSEQLKQEADLSRKTLEKCREVQRMAEDKEKAAIAHMASLEREIKASRESIASHRDKSIMLSHQINALQHQFETSEERNRVTTQMLRERNAEIEALKFEKNRINEQSFISSAPVSEQNEETTKLLESYRQVLTCSACRTRFKNTALVRCMHTFCKQCISDRIESRQRKCPTCGESFGQNDVRTIYI